MSNRLEQLEFKLEKILGFRNMQEKLEKYIFQNGFGAPIVDYNFIKFFNPLLFLTTIVKKANNVKLI